MLLKHLIPLFSYMNAAGDGGGEGAGGGTATTNTQNADGGAGTGDGKKPDEKIDPLTVNIHEVIEKARKQEKDKLYSQITSAEDKAKAAEERAKKAEEERVKLAEALAKLDPTKKPGEGGEKPAEKPALNEEVVNKLIEATFAKAEQMFSQQVAEANKRVQELENRLKGDEIETYKNSLISQNKDSIIPELVTGKTREELDTNLILAKQAFARLAQKFGNPGNAGGTAIPTASTTITLPPTPSVAGKASPGAPVAVDVRTLDPKSYKESRAALLAAASAEARKALANEP